MPLVPTPSHPNEQLVMSLGLSARERKGQGTRASPPPLALCAENPLQRSRMAGCSGCTSVSPHGPQMPPPEVTSPLPNTETPSSLATTPRPAGPQGGLRRQRGASLSADSISSGCPEVVERILKPTSGAAHSSAGAATVWSLTILI